MTARPWTSGPWVAESNEFLPRIDVVAADDCGTFVADTPLKQGHGMFDARLIALAPEMAEAILRLRDEYDTKGEQQAVLHAIRVVAPMIDAIGGTND